MNARASLGRSLQFCAALALLLASSPALAWQVDHSAHVMPKPEPKKAVKPKPKPKPTSAPAPAPAKKSASAAAPVDHAAMGHATPPAPVDHAAMGHAMPPPPTPPVDHAAMGHAMPPPPTPPVDHAAMGHAMPPAAPVDHAAMGHSMPPGEPREPIPTLTDADRAAAFPVVEGHAAHDQTIHSYWLMDQLEAWDADGDGTALGWSASAWVGTDLDRLWLRSEGEHVDGRVEAADIEVLYGRSVARWWDVVAGIRQDFGEGPSRTYAAIGVMGLAPYKFEVQATAYIGQSGRTAARVEAEYDTLLTNRWILQWKAEADFHGKDDPELGIGKGLGTVEAGLRLRYEITRQFAPYVGLVWERAYGDTADYRRQSNGEATDTRWVVGLRFWF